MSETFSVPEMSCGHCKTTVENAVSSLGGVRSAEVNLEAKTVTVDHDDSVENSSIVGAIEEAGYQVA
ncbi:MAG: heavy-metal-associated domain-containing protein [Actinomycetota bacterium]